MTKINFVPCRACRNPVSVAAKACPTCGAPRQTGWSAGKIVVVAVLSFVGLILVVAIAGAPAGKQDEKQSNDNSTAGSRPAGSRPAEHDNGAADKASEEAISITADKLSADYKANEVRADDMYKGKLLRVSGTVKSIGKDILDNPYIVIQTAHDFLGVHAEFDSDDTRALARISKGDQVVVRCRCSGLTLASPYLKDCVLE